MWKVLSPSSPALASRHLAVWNIVKEQMSVEKEAEE
jgi:hypothetical protein